MTAADLHFSPFDPEQTKNPYPIWDRLRGECPVYKSSMGSDEWMVDDAEDAGAVYVVTKHEDIAYILEHPDKFTSGEDKNGPGIPPEVLEELAKGLPLSTTLYNTDPPEHTRMRTLVGQGLSQQRVAENAPQVRATAEALAAALTGGSAELLDQYVRPLANTALLDFLGVPRAEQEQVCGGTACGRCCSSPACRWTTSARPPRGSSSTSAGTRRPSRTAARTRATTC